MARILIDARCLSANPTGVGRYARALIAHLAPRAIQAGHELTLLRHPSHTAPLHPELALPQVTSECPPDNLKNHLIGHRALEDAVRQLGQPELYHSLFHILPRYAHRVMPQARIVTTLHDLVWLDHPDASQPTWLKARSIQTFARAAIPHALRASDAVIAISRPTAERAHQLLGRHQIPVPVIHHGVDPRFFDAPPPITGPLRWLGQPEAPPFFVAIGNHKPYKNLHTLIDAFARLPRHTPQPQLVLIGDCEGLSAHIGPSQVSEHIHLTGLIDDDQLRALLGRATAFVFPSLVEGFGLPILEAMAMGRPTLVSDLEPMRSIAGEAALLFHPHSPDDLARLLQRLLTAPPLARNLGERSLARARTFCWDKTADETLRVYEKTMATQTHTA
ncbi:hypothetical protein DL240_06930 [Lujinxingia litoralis]|uniref:Glycosyltransferase family 1 protein n=1 Tax=Lujinxingia litoralis TaxID=2211119 RepID=A0A328C966_9DELT|nr:glycosyltransferase family 1 protein [Lujinxingia litoralis]RAL23876.1 hypothetical protein DL240_06930 [Lujinxingia litoralis]